MQIKMVEREEGQAAFSTMTLPDIQDVQFLSGSYDTLVESKTTMAEDLKRFS